MPRKRRFRPLGHTGERDLSDFSIANLLLPPLRDNAPPVRSLPQLEVEDRRLWNPIPLAVRALKSPRRWRHRLVVASVRRPTRSVGRRLAASGVVVPHAVRFSNPRHLMLCVRRRVRREIIFALRLRGRGAGRRRKPRRNQYSDIRC